MISGFFPSIENTKSTINREQLTCVYCGLYKNCQSPRMKPFGNFKRGILNIGEAPGEVEDTRGKQWQGKTGRLLQRTYEELGVDLFEDCLNINAVNCRPMDGKNNRTPKSIEVDCCRAVIVSKLIEEYKPNIIVPLGGSAVYSLLGGRWKKDLGGISKWRGWMIPDRGWNAWVCPTFHPSYVERGEEEVMTIWRQDLQQIVKKIGDPLPPMKEPNIQMIDDLSPLSYIPQGSVVSIDFETTGLKPHAEGHQVVCVSVAYSENDCYVFPLPNTKQGRKPLTNLLGDPKIMKMAHNMKFEDAWSRIRLRQPINGWHWDSMLAAHVLDNRPGVTGLKFQTYVNFGIVDYSSEIDPYLKSSGGGGNDLNKTLELFRTPSGKEKLMKYCALDTIYQYRLAMKQIEILDNLPF